MSREASGQALLAAHYRVDGHPFINPIQVNTAFELQPTAKIKEAKKLNDKILFTKAMCIVKCVSSIHGFVAGGCGWRQECLPDVPSLPRRPPLLRADTAEAARARSAAPLPSDRLGCALCALQGYRAARSQVKKVCLHRWVKVRDSRDLFTASFYRILKM